MRCIVFISGSRFQSCLNTFGASVQLATLQEWRWMFHIFAAAKNTQLSQIYLYHATALSLTYKYNELKLYMQSPFCNVWYFDWLPTSIKHKLQRDYFSEEKYGIHQITEKNTKNKLTNLIARCGSPIYKLFFCSALSLIFEVKHWTE